MASQNNTGRQYNKTHAVTIVATAAVEQYRFIAYDGTHATSAGGTKDSQGITETAGAIGEAVSAITAYSGLVVASEAIAFGAFVKPAADGTGRAAVGAADDYCGRALGAATAAGDIIEIQPLTHVHPAA
ncbi:MAG: DUF2190 domain-containing protein [Bordetella sp. SCN 67-23]|nr:DUF2190 family protein [Burkholderiales bacterium]ODS75886.1 MAG: DUF2190 domain-containing protein [Bordetella sp. SCN 67-23]OJW91762.1 MAG: DUF2190 domain-containing protein [Burkholderiales bacterium 67-32]